MWLIAGQMLILHKFLCTWKGGGADLNTNLFKRKSFWISPYTSLVLYKQALYGE